MYKINPYVFFSFFTGKLSRLSTQYAFSNFYYYEKNFKQIEDEIHFCLYIVIVKVLIETLF